MTEEEKHDLRVTLKDALEEVDEVDDLASALKAIIAADFKGDGQDTALRALVPVLAVRAASALDSVQALSSRLQLSGVLR